LGTTRQHGGVFSNRARANWYAQLSQQTAVGLTLVDAIEQTRGPKPEQRRALIAALQTTDVAQALKAHTPWLGDLDRPIWVAALQSGRFPEAASSLAEHYRELGRTRGKVLMALLYPMFVLHVAVFALPLIHQTLGSLDLESTSSAFCFNVTSFSQGAIAGLALIWGPLFLLNFWRQAHPASLLAVLRHLPLIGQYLRANAMERFTRLLGDLLESGVSLRKSLTLSGEASGDPRMQQASRQLAEAVGMGRPPGGLMGSQRVWPADFVAVYQTGEKTGQLESTLREQAKHYRSSATRWLAAAAFFYPQAVFMLVAASLAGELMRAYGHYLQQIQNMM